MDVGKQGLKRGLRGLRAGASVVAISIGLSYAATATAAAPAKDDAATTVGEVVVTAQKRAETTKEVPLSITAITGAKLEQNQSTNLTDYVKDVPGMAVIGSGQPGREQVVLRGVTTGPGEALPQVAFYLNETPYGFSNGYTLPNSSNLDSNLFDADHVEVLKGPQGTLYGSAAMGGLVKIVTRAPDATDYSAHILTGVSATEHGGTGYEAKAAFNVPLVQDRLALRAVIYDQYDAGFTDNVFNGAKNIDHTALTGGRLSLRWNATDDLRVDLSGNWDRIDSATPASQDVNAQTGKLIYGDYKQNSVVPETDLQNSSVYSGVITWSPRWFTMTSATSYTERTATFVSDISDEVQPVLPSAKVVSVLDPGRRFTEELRFASPTDQSIEWLAGVYYNRETATLNQALSLYVLPPSLAANLPSDYRETAGFGDVTVKFSKSFDVTLGVRSSGFRQSVTQDIALAPPLAPFAFTVTPPPAVSSGQDTTYSASAHWRPTENVTAYARFSQGFNPGGVNIPEPPDPKVDPERLNNYEAGVKAELFDHRLRFDLSAYHIDWSNIVVTGSRADQTAFVINGGKATGDGVELQGQLVPAEGLVFTFNADAPRTRFEQAVPELNVKSGSRFAGVPRSTYSLSGEKTFPLGENLSDTFGVDVSYVGDSLSGYSAVAGSQVAVPAYTNVDLRDRISFRRVKLDFYVKNLFDQQEITNIRTDSFILAPPFAATVRHEYLGRPRTIGLTLTADF